MNLSIHFNQEEEKLNSTSIIINGIVIFTLLAKGEWRGAEGLRVVIDKKHLLSSARSVSLNELSIGPVHLLHHRLI